MNPSSPPSRLPPDFFTRNRTAVYSDLKESSVAILHSNAPIYTNADGTLRYIQNSNLFYLCGINQKETILMILKEEHSSFKEILFIKPIKRNQEIWEGNMLSVEAASQISGIQEIRFLSEFENFLTTQLLRTQHIYLALNEHPRAIFHETKDLKFSYWIQKKFPLHPLERLAPIINRHRVIKSEAEVAIIRKAVSITELALRKLMPEIEAGKYEYEMEAVLGYEFIRHGAKGESGSAYSPILASGKNSCVLHYTENNRKLESDDILLVDAGAEYASYCADITRTFPVSKVYTARMKQVYLAVKSVLDQAIQLIQPGKCILDYKKETNQLMEEELIRLGLITKEEGSETKKSIQDFYMHGISHQIGLDVHDAEDNSSCFQAGMVITCEPGIYILNEKLGIRLEENILVTPTDCENLSDAIPIDPDEIESLMHS